MSSCIQLAIIRSLATLLLTAGATAFGADNSVVHTLGGAFANNGGQASAAQLFRPFDVATDGAGLLYVADRNISQIRTIDTNGVINVFAGTSTAGGLGAGGQATQGQLYHPFGVCAANGSVFVADSDNNTVRKIDGTGTITVIAGMSGSPGYSGDHLAATDAQLFAPWGVTVAADGTLYIAEVANHCIRKVDPGGTITTICGNGVAGAGGDNAQADQAQLNSPQRVALDNQNHLLIADTGNNSLRQIDLTSMQITQRLAIDVVDVVNDGAGNIYYATNDRIYALAANNTSTLIAGNGSYAGYSPDGAATATPLWPTSICATPDGTIYVVEEVFSRLRKISNGQITTISGGARGDNGPATTAGVARVIGTKADSAGNIYLPDFRADRVRKIAPGGTITTFAGTGIQGSGGDGTALGTKLSLPSDVVVDSLGNVFIAEVGNGDILKVMPGGSVSTFVTGIPDCYNLAADSFDNIYALSFFSGKLYKITPGGSKTLIAGTSQGYFGDGGQASNAKFNLPLGLAVDTAGNIYIGDTGNHRVRMIDTGGYVNTIAGTGVAGFSADGTTATSAKLNGPRSVGVDNAGNVYIADSNNARIRIVTKSNGQISTIVGTGTPGHTGDGGPGTAATIEFPWGMWVDPTGSRVVHWDWNYFCVREWVAGGAPSASSGVLAVQRDTAKDGGLTASDPNGDTLVFSIVTQPQHGSVTITDAATGAFTYTPSAGYTGNDTITFRVNDGTFNSNVAAVAVTVLPPAISVNAGDAQSATVGTAFGVALSAIVLNGAVPMQGVAVNFVAPASGASGTFGGGVTTASVNTDVNGVATAPAFTAGTLSGAYQVTATASGVSGVAIFNLTNAPGPVNHFRITLPDGTPIVPLYLSNGPDTLLFTAQDAYNNTVTTFNSSADSNFSYGNGGDIDTTAPFNSGVLVQDLNELRPDNTYSFSITLSTTSPPASGSASYFVLPPSAGFRIIPQVHSVGVGEPLTCRIDPPFALYSGTVHFTSSDPLAVMPPDYTFSANGSHNVVEVFYTLGTQFLHCNDVSAPWLTETFASQPPYVDVIGPFSNLSALAIPFGTATTLLGGTIAYGATIPTGAVTISIGGVSAPANIDPATGNFTASFDTSALSPTGSPYTIDYSYPGDGISAAASATSQLTVLKITPTISWSNPGDVIFGTALNTTQLNASPSTQGSFVYTPAAGTKLNAGAGQSLSTLFTPDDTSNFTSATKNVSINVLRAAPVITWAKPAAIVAGTGLSGAQLNASANVAGVFTYTPPAGTVLGIGANQSLSVAFAPADSANYTAAAALTAIDVLNAAPVITSQPLATPNPAISGKPVAFAADANNVDGDALTFAWSFGDGTSATGGSVTHTYTAPGDFTAQVTVMDAHGASVSAAVVVTVGAASIPIGGGSGGGGTVGIVLTDSNGDGIPDAMQAAADANAIGTPMESAALSGVKLGIRLNFAHGNSDSIKLSGALTPPTGFKTSGAAVIVDVGGVVRTFKLDRGGKGKSGGDTFTLTLPKRGSTAKFAMVLQHGAFAQTLADVGLVNATLKKQPVDIPVAIMLGDGIWTAAPSQLYTATRTKSGSSR
jgi:hypothetical protein